MGGRACIRFVWQAPVSAGSSTRRRGWSWVFACGMRSRHRRRCMRPGRGIRFWRCGSGCWWRRCCSCRSRRTKWGHSYQEGRDASSVCPVAVAVDHGERHLVIPLRWVDSKLRSRGLSVVTTDGTNGRVCPAIYSSSRIFSTDRYLLTLASLKMGKLAPSASLKPSSWVKVK